MFYIVFISSKTNEHKYCYGVCKRGQKQQKLNFSRRNGWRCRYLIVYYINQNRYMGTQTKESPFNQNIIIFLTLKRVTQTICSQNQT